MIRLEQRFVNSLLAQPESGMGYQLVNVERPDGSTFRGVAYNAELVLREDEARSVLRATSYERLVENAVSSQGSVKAVVVRREIRSANAVREGPSSGEAKDAPVEETTTGEVFKRFSAYQNDRRVTADKGLLPGTYATTKDDADKHIKTGSDATKRYALPNPAPASWVFTSKPHAGTPIQRGTVAPANGQPGGGDEVIFPSGTQPHTTTGPVKIPD